MSLVLLFKGLCVLGQAQVVEREFQVSGMLGGQAVVAVAVHIARHCNDPIQGPRMEAYYVVWPYRPVGGQLKGLLGFI